MSMCEPEMDIRGLFQMLSALLFEIGCLNKYGVHQFGLVSWPENSRNCPVSASPLGLQNTRLLFLPLQLLDYRTQGSCLAPLALGLQDSRLSVLTFYVGLNANPHACAGSTLSMAPFSQMVFDFSQSQCHKTFSLS